MRVGNEREGGIIARRIPLLASPRLLPRVADAARRRGCLARHRRSWRPVSHGDACPRPRAVVGPVAGLREHVAGSTECGPDDGISCTRDARSPARAAPGASDLHEYAHAVRTAEGNAPPMRGWTRDGSRRRSDLAGRAAGSAIGARSPRRRDPAPDVAALGDGRRARDPTRSMPGWQRKGPDRRRPPRPHPSASRTSTGGSGWARMAPSLAPGTAGRGWTTATPRLVGRRPRRRRPRSGSASVRGRCPRVSVPTSPTRACVASRGIRVARGHSSTSASSGRVRRAPDRRRRKRTVPPGRDVGCGRRDSLCGSRRAVLLGMRDVG